MMKRAHHPLHNEPLWIRGWIQGRCEGWLEAAAWVAGTVIIGLLYRWAVVA